MRWRPLVLLATGWALLLAAWTIGNPPFAAPDEADHYVRAVGVSSGHGLGRPAGDVAPGATPRQRAWTRQATRAVNVPAPLTPPVDCYLPRPQQSAACLDKAPVPTAPTTVVTAVGTYQPLPYLLPAMTVRLGGDARAAVRWARAPSALVALALLVAAALVVRDPAGDARALLGLMAAVTPMVLFCGASLTGSGMEIAAAIALTSALLRLTRGTGAPRAAWGLAAVAGATLVLSRSDGPLWAALLLAAGLAVAGRRGASERLRGAPAAATVTGAALLIAVVLNRLWEAAYGPHVEIPTRAIPLGVRTGVEQWGRASRELVGGFGYLEYVLPLWVALAWLAVVAALVALAVRRAPRRQRGVLVGVVGAAAVLPVVLYVVVIRGTGFGLQGRHVLPLAVAVPLLAGELTYRYGDAIARSRLAVLGVVVAVVQLVAFWLNARRSAVGVDGPLVFLGDAQWSPPLGWPFLMALALLGSGALVAALVTAQAPAPARR